MNRIGISALLLLIALPFLVSACKPVTALSTASATVTPAAASKQNQTVTPVSAPSVKPAPVLLTAEELKNGVYGTEFATGGRVQLVNGVYEEKATKPTANRVYVTLGSVIAYGDLNGDGKDDAVVTLAANTGGSGTFKSLEAVISDNGRPKHVATVSLGDRVVINAITITSGLITVNMITHAPQDPLCCPTLEVAKKYRLQGEKLLEVG